MKKFMWTGISNGKNESGTIDAPDKTIALALLADKNISTIHLKQFKKTKLKQADYYFLLSELSDLFNANVSLIDAIHIIASTHQKFFTLCNKLEILLQNGNSFAQAIQSCNLYNTTIYTLIHTGEQTGQLGLILKKIIEQHTQQQTVLKTIKKSLMYPFFVLTITLLVLLVMLFFIVPKFSTLYQQFNNKLPLFTHIILTLSNTLKTHGAFIFISIIVLASILIFLIKHYKTKALEYLLYIPYLNTLLTDSLYARIFFLLNTCLTSGLSLHQALTLTTPTISFKRYQISFSQTLSQLKAGYAFSKCLDPALFPEKIRQWIIIAESSGTFDLACKTISDHYSNILNEKSEKISLLIEPFTMLVLGLCIGSIVVALYLPLFQIGLAM